jgi:hypothetical protein
MKPEFLHRGHKTESVEIFSYYFLSQQIISLKLIPRDGGVLENGTEENTWT